MSFSKQAYQERIIQEFLKDTTLLDKLNGQGLSWGRVKAFCISHLPKSLDSTQKNDYSNEIVEEIITKVALHLGRRVECLSMLDFENGVSKKYFRFVLD